MVVFLVFHTLNLKKLKLQYFFKLSAKRRESKSTSIYLSKTLEFYLERYKRRINF